MASVRCGAVISAMGAYREIRRTSLKRRSVHPVRSPAECLSVQRAGAIARRATRQTRRHSAILRRARSASSAQIAALAATTRLADKTRSLLVVAVCARIQPCRAHVPGGARSAPRRQIAAWCRVAVQAKTGHRMGIGGRSAVIGAHWTTATLCRMVPAQTAA